MAKQLKKIFVPTTDEVVQNFKIQSWHVSQSVDALTGNEDYDITISGSLEVEGPVDFTDLETTTGQTSVLVLDGTSVKIQTTTLGTSGSSGTSGISGTSGSSGSSGTSGSSGSSGTSGSSGSSGTSGEGICNEYRYNTGSGAASGQVVFDSSNDKLYITSSNSDSIDWSEYYEEIVTETLGGTVTLTKVNDTDTYVVFDIDPSTTTYVGGATPHISIGLSTTYGGTDGIVASNGTLTAASDNVCVSFDLFRRKKDIVSPNTPTGGVVVATSDAEQPAASSNIVITGDNITMTGVTYVQTKTQTGINGTNTSWYTVPKANTRGMIIEYVISRTDSAGYRMGQIMATWDDSSGVSFTDVSTKDVPGGASTSDCSVKVTGNAANAIIGIEVASGTYTVTVYVRALGTYS